MKVKNNLNQTIIINLAEKKREVFPPKSVIDVNSSLVVELKGDKFFQMYLQSGDLAILSETQKPPDEETPKTTKILK